MKEDLRIYLNGSDITNEMSLIKLENTQLYRSGQFVRNEVVLNTSMTTDQLVVWHCIGMIKAIPADEVKKLFNVEIIDVEYCENKIQEGDRSTDWIQKMHELESKNGFEILTSINI